MLGSNSGSQQSFMRTKHFHSNFIIISSSITPQLPHSAVDRRFSDWDLGCNEVLVQSISYMHVCKTHSSNNICNSTIPEGCREAHSGAQIVISIRINTTVLENLEAKWSAVGIIERVWVSVDGLRGQITAYLCVGVVHHGLRLTCCISAVTQLSTALAEPTGCTCVHALVCVCMHWCVCVFVCMWCIILCVWHSKQLKLGEALLP